MKLETKALKASLVFMILFAPSVCLTVASIGAAPLWSSLRVGAALREFEHVGNGWHCHLRLLQIFL